MIKSLQNRKGQKNVGYPKKSSLFLIKGLLFCRVPQIFLDLLILKWLYIWSSSCFNTVSYRVSHIGTSDSKWFWGVEGLMKLISPNLLKPIGTIIQENYQSFYPLEPFRITHFNIKHPALLLFEGICGHCNGNFTLRGHLLTN